MTSPRSFRHLRILRVDTRKGEWNLLDVRLGIPGWAPLPLPPDLADLWVLAQVGGYVGHSDIFQVDDTIRRVHRVSFYVDDAEAFAGFWEPP